MPGAPPWIEARLKKIFAVVFFFLGCVPPAQGAEGWTLESGKTQNAFIELYTSDASRDSNTALEWMSALKTRDAGALWKQWVPVEFHVNCWDVAGFKDKFAQKPFDDLLLQYKKKWNVRSVYAPTLVLNGTEWTGWSRGQEIPTGGTKEVGVLKVLRSESEGLYSVEFTPAKTLSAQNLAVHAVLTGFGFKSRPSEGENRGHALSHDFIALNYAEQPLKRSYGVLKANVELSAPNKGVHAQEYAVVFWVRDTETVQPIQAVGGYLPK